MKALELFSCVFSNSDKAATGSMYLLKDGQTQQLKLSAENLDILYTLVSVLKLNYRKITLQ